MEIDINANTLNQIDNYLRNIEGVNGGGDGLVRNYSLPEGGRINTISFPNGTLLTTEDCSEEVESKLMELCKK